MDDINQSNNKKIKPLKKKIPFKSSFFFLALLAGVISSIFFSSRFLIGNPSLGNTYGGGIQVTVDLKNINSNGTVIPTKIKQETLTAAENSIYKRTSDLNLGKPKILTNKDIETQDYSFTITQPKIKSAEVALWYVNQLIDKSNLSFYTANDNPLFDINGYKKDLPKRKAGDNIKRLKMVQPNSAKYDQERKGSRLLNVVSFVLNNSRAKIQYTKALTALQSAKSGNNKLIVWAGYNGLWDLVQQQIKLKTDYKEQWKASGENLYKYVHNWEKDSTGKWKIQSSLRTSPFNASDYLISDAPVKSSKVSTDKVYINNSFSPSIAKALAARINYGTSSYKLIKLGDYSFVHPHSVIAVNRLVISAIIIASLIIIFMLTRYGIFGLISSLVLIFSINVIIALFVVVLGSFTLLTLAGLIFSVIVILDTSIITFERLKKELYQGKSVIRAMNASNKHATKILFDSSFIMMIISFVIFYIGSQFIPGFSLIVVLSIIFTVLTSFFLIKLLTYILIKLGTFDKRLYLIGHRISKKEKYLKNQDTLIKTDYSQKSKWIILGSIITIFIGIITFSVTAGISKSFFGGFNSDINLLGGKQVYIRSVLKKPKSGRKDDSRLPQIFTTKELHAIYITKDKFDKNVSSIQTLYSLNDTKAIDGISITFNNSFDTTTFTKKLRSDYPTPTKTTKTLLDIHSTTFTNFIDKKTFKKALLGLLIVFLAIVIYILFRFRWTLSLATLIALVHDGLIITSIFIITRLPFSSLFLIGIIVVLFYSIFTRVLLFDRIKTHLKGTKITSANQFRGIINKSLGETFNRNIIIFIIFSIITFTLIVIPHSSNITLIITMIIGVIISWLSLYLVFPWIWIKLEKFRFNRIKKNKNSHVWDVNVPQEESFPNINDFKGI